MLVPEAMPFGDKAMITQFFSVSLRLRQALALRHGTQKDLGRELCTDGRWETGEGRERQTGISSCDPRIRVPPAPLFLRMLILNPTRVHEAWARFGTQRSPRHTLSLSNSRTNHRTKGCQVMQNPTFYQLEAILAKLSVQNLVSSQT